MTPLERIVRPIVEGQIRGFLFEHPKIVDAVDWYKPRTDKAQTFINLLSKRIVRDLTCGISTARLTAALLEVSAEAPSKVGCGMASAVGSGVSGTPAGDAA
jgi:hypothetical protein